MGECDDALYLCCINNSRTRVAFTYASGVSQRRYEGAWLAISLKTSNIKSASPSFAFCWEIYSCINQVTAWAGVSSSARNSAPLLRGWTKNITRTGHELAT